MMLLTGLALSAIVAIGTPQDGPPPAAPYAVAEPGPAGSSSATADDLPISLDRIQRALSRPPALSLRTGRIVFRVEVIGRKMTIEDILGPDYLKGPVPSSGMSHQEFLNMVTPKDYQGYAAFNNREALTVAATSFALQWALQRAVHKFETAKQDREREAARQEVQAALADLEQARLRAGLPPK